MPSPPRIPRLFADFRGYINLTASYLFEDTPEPNYRRLNISEEEATTWRQFAEQWNPLYSLYIDKHRSRTANVRAELLSIMNSAINFDRSCHFLDRIGSSPNTTIRDVEIFNIRRGLLQKRVYTKPTSAISELVMVVMQPIGGGTMRVRCFGGSARRAAILKPASCVQYCYKVGNTPPEEPLEEWNSTAFSTKASFTLHLGAQHFGKMLYIHLRWYSTRHPHLSGPWSSQYMTVIL